MRTGLSRRLLERPLVERVFDISLLAMLASGYLAVLGSGTLDLPSALAGGLALGARALHLAGILKLSIPERWVTIATAAYIGFYAVDYFFLSQNFITATIHLVFFVAIVKLLTARTQRDFLFLNIIAFLELLAASLLSGNLSFFVFLVLFVISTVAAFASSEMLRSWKGAQVVSRGATAFPRRFALLTLLSAGGILMLTAGLFFVLPRTARAALEHLIPANTRAGGIANEVTLGQLGEIRRRSTALLHVKFENGTPAKPMKYRGGALAEFNGWKWYNSHQPGRALRPVKGLYKLANDDQLRRPGKRLSYQVSVRGMAAEQIFLAGIPEYVQLPRTLLWEMPTGGYRLPWAEPDGLRYVAYTYLEDAKSPAAPPPPPLGQNERNFHLRLPPVDPRVMEMAQRITLGAKTETEKARLLERYLQTQFAYSLDPLERQVDDPLAYFLCERKKGHCEYFASSMAVMLRLLWIPSRVVTGFQSGILNPMSGWHVVRASDAHSWVEAWIPGKGWVEFDPTPPDLSPVSGAGLWTRASLLLDAAETFWQDWVVGYDLDHQVALALRVERSSRGLRWEWAERLAERARSLLNAPAEWNPVYPVAGLLIAALLVGGWLAGPGLTARLRSLLRLRRLARGGSTASDAELLYREMLKVLRRRGIEKPAWMTPLEFSRIVQGSSVAAPVEEFTQSYYDFRFGGALTNAPRLATLLEQIRRLP